MNADSLCAITGDVLQNPGIKASDNFFSIGGDSLSAIRLCDAVLAECGIRIEYIDILQNQTMEKLSALLERRSGSSKNKTIEPISVKDGGYELSAVQSGLYFLDQMTAEDDINNPTVVFCFNGVPEKEFAVQAVKFIVERHTILRSNIILENGLLRQKIHPIEGVRNAIQYADLRGDSEFKKLSLLQKHYDDMVKAPFDLASDQLFRFALVCFDSNLTVGLLSLHHIIADGFSEEIFENEFRYFYDQVIGQCLLNEVKTSVSKLDFQYKDYAHWLNRWVHSPEGGNCLKSWQSALRGYGGALVSGKNITENISFAADSKEFSIEVDLYQCLTGLSHQYEVTLFIVLQSLIKLLLFLQKGEPDIVLGSPVTVRDAIPMNNQIGPFLNTLPIRNKLSFKQNFQGLLEDVNKASTQAFAAKLYPLEVMAEKLGYELPMFDVGFTLHNQLKEGHAFHEIKKRIPGFEYQRVANSLPTELWISAYEELDSLRLHFLFRKDAQDKCDVEGLMNLIPKVIEGVSANPNKSFESMLASWGLAEKQTDEFAINLNL